MSDNQPIRLTPIFRERVWGRKSLEPFFSQTTHTEPIGEVWFTFSENLTTAGKTLGELLLQQPEILGTAADPAHPGVCPLLVKILFTTERLSVQVHPDDAYARQHHDSLGKTEAWYVIAAEPPGEVAVGFREPISAERLRESAESGEIEGLLDWRKVKAEDLIYTPAGTVHAIGAGLTVCEIQENSDITYRLYDYGRPRELHVEHGMKVSHLGPHEYEAKRISLAAGRDELVASDYFRIERLRPKRLIRLEPNSPYYLLLISLKGSGTIDHQPFKAGECWLIPAGNEALEIAGEQAEWLLTYTAEKPSDLVHVS